MVEKGGYRVVTKNKPRTKINDGKWGTAVPCNHKWIFDYTNLVGRETMTPILEVVLHCEKCGEVKISEGRSIKSKQMKPAKPSNPPGDKILRSC